MSGKRNVLKQADQFKVAKYIENNVERFAGRSIDSVRDEVAAHFKFDVTSTNIRSIATHIECEWWKTEEETQAERMDRLETRLEIVEQYLRPNKIPITGPIHELSIGIQS